MKKKARILIIDDEPNIRKILQAALERVGYRVVATESAENALRLLSTESFDLIITDVLMPGMGGMEFLWEVKARMPHIPVLMVTAFGTIPQAVEAIRAGAVNYITKPFDLQQVKKEVAYWLKHTPNRAVASSKPTTGDRFVVAESPRMVEVMGLVRKIADTTVNVLITGESGTGKEVIAKEIHRLSRRRDKPFIPVSCAAIPETLLESELFGHEKGAFTGADHARPGRFELADGGTLFLDEIGEVPLSIQVKLLRVLQEREVERLGATSSVKVDVRLIAATNKDLSEAVARGEFRQDLYYRLQVLHIELPPLRERPEDIKPLILHFLSLYAPPNGSAMKNVSEDALAILLRYPWPGNVRELENVVERAVVLSPKEQEVLTPDLLPPHLQRAA
ncbi:MAG: sigma-54 dependent transcriptional regulator [Candidatus Caldarchaeum sp.]